MYACICRGIAEADVRRVGRAGIVAPDALIAVLGLDDQRCCGRCAATIERFVALAWEGASETGVGSPTAAGADLFSRRSEPNSNAVRELSHSRSVQ
jgi:bacterioferritin-associated ferredoxin